VEASAVMTSPELTSSPDRSLKSRPTLSPGLAVSSFLRNASIRAHADAAVVDGDLVADAQAALLDRAGGDGAAAADGEDVGDGHAEHAGQA
jgi:hypothetical protein